MAQSEEHATLTADVGEDAEKEELNCIAGGNANWCSHSGKQYGGSSKNRTILQMPSNCTTRHLSKGCRCAVSKGHMHPMFIAALSTIAKVWKEHKCPWMDEWIKKMWYIYTMEYYSAIKKNDILPFATT